MLLSSGGEGAGAVVLTRLGGLDVFSGPVFNNASSPPVLAKS